MKIISFAYTTPSLVAGAKTVTRRDWEPGYAARFKAGELVAAYDRSPRARGRQVATIRLTQRPYLQPMREMPDSDYEAEGFAWLLAHPAHLPKTMGSLPPNLHEFTREGFEHWRTYGNAMWVVRFELVEVLVPLESRGGSGRQP